MTARLRLIDTDAQFFAQWPQRLTLIRAPIGDESRAEFVSLGPHDASRRRIIIYKVPRENKISPGKILKIPILLFSDESIENNDDILLPMIFDLMKNAANRYGIKRD